ncbi:MAG: SMP-30/gluconolactonase/LRE family protein [Thermogemmata sp.]|nr:SMP-30/gluconolactonase/LRE family protein [Thermogemmata sp.]
MAWIRCSRSSGRGHRRFPTTFAWGCCCLAGITLASVRASWLEQIPTSTVGWTTPVTCVGEETLARQYQAFVLQEAAWLRQGDRPPASKEQWEQQAAALRKYLYEAWGGERCFVEPRCPLEPQQHGEPLKREGYTVEKISFQTRPGVRMTANLYIPDAARRQPAPALLMVHGHWKLAKQEPTVQLRCIGAAKLGFVVLCVDAFGAGERGIGKALGEYHGEMVAATLLPSGLTLCGLQVYENMRAVDYLETRPEVDKTRIGITGASGGGNQTMYAAAWDQRLRCAVPVCSVGNYQAYLQTACCLCEVVPGALRFTEEWAVLALMAPRPLMVINAAKDSIQFSPAEARKSLKLTAPVYQLYGRPELLQHIVVDEGHGYSKAMREAMYGFMCRHLKGVGDGSPIAEPPLQAEKPEDLRCYPGESRPDDFVTLPRLAYQEGQRMRTAAEQRLQQQEQREAARHRLRQWVEVEAQAAGGQFQWQAHKQADGTQIFQWHPTPGIGLRGRLEPGSARTAVMILHLDGAEAARNSAVYRLARRLGLPTVTFDLRATGPLAPERNRVGRAVDHNAAQWGLWLGRPLLQQWLWDIHTFWRVLRQSGALPAGGLVLVGDGPAGILTLAAAATAPADLLAGCAVVDAPVTLLTDQPYEKMRLGLLVPGMVRDVGDVPHLAALSSPIPLAIVGGTNPQGKALPAEQVRAAYRFTQTLAQREQPHPRQITWTTLEKLFVDLKVAAAVEYTDAPVFEPGATLRVLARDGAAGEGPAWDPELGVLTSGVRGIHQWTPDGQQRVWRENAGTNGLLFDRDGTLVCCEPAFRSVSRIRRDGQRIVLTDRFNGKKYNQPNDLTIDTAGRIYFSDPRYGDRSDMQQRDEQGRTIEGVYRIDRDGQVHRIIGREVERANGVLVSRDDRYLFVADNNNDTIGGARKLWRFDLKPDGTIDPKSRKLLYDWGQGRGPDGIKQDSQGRLYVAAGLNKPHPPAEPADNVPAGIYVIEPDSGKLLAFLPVPTDEVTNCAFGGQDRRTLFITAGGVLYSIRTTTPGHLLWPPADKRP